MFRTFARRRRATRAFLIEVLETRSLLNAAFDVTGITDLRNDNAFNAIDGDGIGIAILDTGLFANHPDLRGNFTVWFDAVKNGRSAQTNPGDPNIADAFDPEGHGSHVSGTAASTNPEIGVATAAELIGVRVLPANNERQPQFDSILAGLDWVLANHDRFNIKVVNMSLGVPSVNTNSVPRPDDESRAIDELEQVGVTVVTASGNGYGGFEELGASVPGAFSTIQVANTWKDSGSANDRAFEGLDTGSGNGTFSVLDDRPRVDQLAASSQRSTLPNQVAAPGTSIFSTWNGDNGLMYNSIRGTSMASPLVAGAVALMQDAAHTFGGRYLKPSEVLKVLRDTADNIVDSQTTSTRRQPLQTDFFGQLIPAGPIEDIPETGQTFKRINVYNAIQKVRDMVTTGGNIPTPPPDPGQRTDDTNNTIASAVELPSLDGTAPVTASGSINADGQVVIGAKDVDLFKLTLESPGTVSLDVEAPAGGSNLTAFVRFFDGNGSPLGQLSGALPLIDSSGVLAAGTFYLGISGAGNQSYNITNGTGATTAGTTGGYTLTFALLNPDPNGVAQGAFGVDLINPDVLHPTLFDNSVTVPASKLSGTIGRDPIPLDDTTSVNVGDTDVDIFQIVAPDTGVLTIDTESQFVYNDSVDTFVRVFDANLTELNSADDIVSQQQTDTHLQVSLTEGEVYYVAVTTFGNRNFNISDPFGRSSSTSETGQYDLYLSFSNGDVNGTVYGSVDFLSRAVNNSVIGVIGADFNIPLLSQFTNGGYKDVDFFTYTPPQDGTLDLRAVGSTVSPVAALWNFTPGGNDIIKEADTEGGDARLIFPVTAGQQFFFSVTGRGNDGFNWFAPASGSGGDTGNYTLTASLGAVSQFNQLTNDSINLNTPEDIQLDSALTRNIGRDGPAVVGDADLDIYRFISSAAQRITIRTDTSDEDSADTFLRVFNANGQEIAFNDNSSDSTRNSQITFDAAAGTTYFIGVNGAGPDAQNYNPLTGANAASGSTGNYRILLNAAATLPTVSISQPAPISEGDTDPVQVSLTITLSETSSQSVSVLVETAPSSASENTDFAPFSGTISFDPGELSKTIDITIQPDHDDEPDESFFVDLSNAQGAVIGDSRATIDILDNDAAPAPEVRLFQKFSNQFIEISTASATADFGNVRTGQARPVRIFRVTNSGTAPLDLGTLRLPRGFVLTDGLVGTLAPGKSDTFKVAMLTSTAAGRSGQLRFLTDDPDEPTVRLRLTGVITARRRKLRI